MKLWGGRFTKSTDTGVESFNSSIGFDARLYRQDIAGSIAHARMLGKQGIISSKDTDLILEGLSSIRDDIEKGMLTPDGEEDIHTFIEKNLISRIGEAGKRLHTGRSRNDQVALDMRMYLKEQINCIKSKLLDLLEVLLKTSSAHTETIMPGYTHLQKAQPVTLAHHMMAYFSMFSRDVQRLEDCYSRTDVMPLGSGALAATSYPLDRNMVAKELGFSSVSENSLDAVSDRDFAIELSFCISMIMMHLSRFSEEVILWSTEEFGFIEQDDSFSTGSSIMPQKKNPDVAELVRGKSGRCFGNLAGLLTVMKALPLAYNKDMQEDKESVFDSIDTVNRCLPVFTGMLSCMTINRENMLRAAQKGFTNATDVADYLVEKGIPFRNAHETAGKLVLYCIDNGIPLEKAPLSRLKDFSEAFEKDIYERISLKKCISVRKIQGGPSPESVKASLEKGRKFIKQHRT